MEPIYPTIVSSNGQETMTFILTVEDEQPLREYLGEILEDAGYRVIAAADADEAIAVLESRNDVQTVITDINMPGSMDGLKHARLDGRTEIGSGGAGQMAADQDHHCDRQGRARSRRNAARQPVRAKALPAGQDSRGRPARLATTPRVGRSDVLHFTMPLDGGERR
jgi:hypothetical protein